MTKNVLVLAATGDDSLGARERSSSARRVRAGRAHDFAKRHGDLRQMELARFRRGDGCVTVAATTDGDVVIAARRDAPSPRRAASSICRTLPMSFATVASHAMRVPRPRRC